MLRKIKSKEKYNVGTERIDENSDDEMIDEDVEMINEN